MTKRRVLLASFILTLVATPGLRVVILRAQQPLTTAPTDAEVAYKIANIKPFTITSSSLVSSADGHTEPGDSQTWTGDKDRHAHRITVRNGRSGVLDIDEIEIHTKGFKTTLSNVTKSKTSTVYDSNHMAAFWANSRDPASNCLNLYSGRFASAYPVQVEGFEEERGVRLVRYKSYINPSSVTSSWLAPEYGCAPAKMKYDWQGEGGKTTLSITNAKLGQVDESLFDVPKDYEEVSPSEYYVRASSASTGGKFALAHEAESFARDMQDIRARFKPADEFWATQRSAAAFRRKSIEASDRAAR